MKNLFWLFFLTPALSLYGQGSGTLSKLEETYKGFMTACDQGKGEKALDYLDHNSIVFFELMLNDLWYADSIALEKLPLSEKHTILLLRQITPKEKLVSFTPRDFAIYTLDEIGPPASYVSEGYSLGQLREENSKAFASLKVRNFYADPELEFTKENGHWKLSLLPFIKDDEIRLRKQFIKTNDSEHGFIVFLIESCSGKSLDPNIWKAIKI